MYLENIKQISYTEISLMIALICLVTVYDNDYPNECHTKQVTITCWMITYNYKIWFNESVMFIV